MDCVLCQTSMNNQKCCTLNKTNEQKSPDNICCSFCIPLQYLSFTAISETVYFSSWAITYIAELITDLPKEICKLGLKMLYTVLILPIIKK